MKAMILAAGRGERMKPLTDTCPKPMLTVHGKPLIEYHIERLVAAGITEIVINHAWLGQQIEAYLGDGNRWHADIRYSAETNGALETAGGIANALPLLGQEAFWLVNGDVFTSFDFKKSPRLTQEQLAHLFLVNNPEHNPKGDFAISEGMLDNLSENKAQQQSYTYSGIAIFKPAFFQRPCFVSEADRSGLAAVMPLGPLLREGAKQQKITAGILSGSWTDVGTPERLALLNKDTQAVS
ncbi:N-acetylmuramate alpha-1-phosphate uridylyltransferase MurU [Thalassomonas haliotis]|uniref:Nucleotidyltransferase family protein n=1 Tax=Thalassomonas haliotis TaxID=485448 RepID=A0ABY7VFI9_9GAMM|nr:nucleotidyltransferase family protein [Thalassomonas haliotis]WDE12376.1 nucleotidyltransferase family protein [Thalassomonas haliotis]